MRNKDALTFPCCRALTAASDSADEDDEKEVAELERELSRYR